MYSLYLKMDFIDFFCRCPYNSGNVWIDLVPVITIGIFSYRAYTQSMNEKVKQAALQSIELLNNNMSTQLGIYSDYMGSISVSDTVQNGVASVNKGHPLTSDIVNGIGEMIVTIPFQSTHLKNIRVVSNDRTVTSAF